MHSKNKGKNKLWHYLGIFGIMALLTACNGGENVGNADARDTSTGTEVTSSLTNSTSAENTFIATLTPAQMKAIDLTMGKIEYKELTATIKANGALRVPNGSRGKATPLFKGVVKKLYVQLGSSVSKGQLIATVSNPEFIQLQEEYIATRTKITLAEQETSRQKALNEGQAGVLKNLQNATATLNALQTRQSSLEQQLKLMGIRPASLNNNNMQSTLNITSPISGTISQVYAEIGSFVDSGSPVAEIVNNSALHLDLQVFEKDLPLIKLGQTIHFTLTNNPNQEYDAEVYSIGAAFENESKTIPVHCQVKSDKTGMIDQMNITGIVSLSKAVSPAVPKNAIVNEGGKDFLFVAMDTSTISGNKSFKKTQIMAGITEMGYTAVTFMDSIPPKANIVTNGAFFLNAKLTNVEEE